MGVAQEPLRGGVVFTEDDMAHGREACALPGSKERVHAVPAIERDAERVGLQHAVNVPERVEDRAGIAVVADGATGAVLVPHEIRGVRQHEFHAVGWQGLQDGNAIALHDAVLHDGRLVGGCGHGGVFLPYGAGRFNLAGKVPFSRPSSRTDVSQWGRFATWERSAARGSKTRERHCSFLVTKRRNLAGGKVSAYSRLVHTDPALKTDSL